VKEGEVPTVEERVDGLEVKMETVEKTLIRIETVLLSVDQKVERLDRLFLWLLGIQMTTLVAIMAGMFGIVAKLI
jgi:hypothetical protein